MIDAIKNIKCEYLRIGAEKKFNNSLTTFKNQISLESYISLHSYNQKERKMLEAEMETRGSKTRFWEYVENCYDNLLFIGLSEQQIDDLMSIVDFVETDRIKEETKDEIKPMKEEELSQIAQPVGSVTKQHNKKLIARLNQAGSGSFNNTVNTWHYVEMSHKEVDLCGLVKSGFNTNNYEQLDNIKWGNICKKCIKKASTI
jgi:hypothetical protein